jgi:hypothetical protein
MAGYSHANPLQRFSAMPELLVDLHQFASTEHVHHHPNCAAQVALRYGCLRRAIVYTAWWIIVAPDSDMR